MSFQFFITGTDTNIGKTYVCCALLDYFSNLNYKIIGAKPISAGNDLLDHIYVNQDVYQIKKSSNVEVNYSEINYYAFDQPIAPHIAAKKNNITIDFENIKNNLSKLEKKADIILIEGAGGYHVPLDNKRTIADLITYLNIPIIFVAGIKLGCLNHTILSIEAIKRRKQKIFGWVANIVEHDMAHVNENIEYLNKIFDAPCLAILPYTENSNNDKIKNYFSCPSLK